MRYFRSSLLAFSLVPLSCSSTPTATNDIRTVDFSNFTYRLPDDLVDPREKQSSFTLKEGSLPAERDANGKIDGMGFSLGKVDYADVTGDGLEEALVFVSIHTGGSAVPGILYVYAFSEKSPQQLWSLETGDRADGGLRSARAENGELVIESNIPADSRGDCCPTKFARIRYKWSDGGFHEIHREVLPIVAN